MRENVFVQALSGQNIFNGCCTMKIDFSKLDTLSVRYNNEKSRDFTQAGQNNPPGPLPSDADSLVAAAALADFNQTLLASALGTPLTPLLPPLTCNKDLAYTRYFHLTNLLLLQAQAYFEHFKYFKCKF